MGITISVEEVAIFEGFGAKEVKEKDATLLQAGKCLTQQYMSEKMALEEQTTRMNEKIQQLVTERNTIKNALGIEKAEMLLRESGYYESKEHYEKAGESDCASMTKNDESDDESMADSLNDRFRNLTILPSLKSLGKRKEVEEPMEIIRSKIGNFLKDNACDKEIEQTQGKIKLLQIRSRGNLGELNYKIKEELIDVETEVEVQILDKKFKDMWSIPCNGYRIEIQQIQVIIECEITSRRKCMAKILKIPLNTTDQHFGEVINVKTRKALERYNNNERQQFFQTGANRIPINRSRNNSRIRYNNDYRIRGMQIPIIEDIAIATMDTMDKKEEGSLVALGATKYLNDTNKK
ncbi:hypothetical protein C1645_834179 [Glomus cerebriforme]|uniref:Uncharacterized protein n=1 Tax=Glomus cerebriforme TaxID=658196 RepID=A0A397SB40_9GLOM|nr:hypothetical protein C1645_834179 [Glomus cerebriforme]